MHGLLRKHLAGIFGSSGEPQKPPAETEADKSKKKIEDMKMEARSLLDTMSEPGDLDETLNHLRTKSAACLLKKARGMEPSDADEGSPEKE
jgi:hypothetical protein